MTHSGGKPHEVGDRGQRYEVTVFDENLNKRIVFGWVNDAETAIKMANAAELRPAWKLAQVRDRQATVTPSPTLEPIHVVPGDPSSPIIGRREKRHDTPSVCKCGRTKVPYAGCPACDVPAEVKSGTGQEKQ